MADKPDLGAKKPSRANERNGTSEKTPVDRPPYLPPVSKRKGPTPEEVAADVNPECFRDLLLSYRECRNRVQARAWRDQVIEKIVLATDCTPIRSPFNPTALCPLCGDRPTTHRSTGYAYPEGLRRHLAGWGGSNRQCPIFRRVYEGVEYYWSWNLDG